MTSSARAAQLRERARHLRQLAADIEHLPVMGLEHHADDCTWRGPHPTLCRATLCSNQHQLHAAADDLRWRAYRFERQADELDALAIVGPGLVG